MASHTAYSACDGIDHRSWMEVDRGMRSIKKVVISNIAHNHMELDTETKQPLALHTK